MDNKSAISINRKRGKGEHGAPYMTGYNPDAEKQTAKRQTAERQTAERQTADGRGRRQKGR